LGKQQLKQLDLVTLLVPLGNNPRKEQNVNIFTGAAEREMLKRDTTAHNFSNQILSLYLESRATPGISASPQYNVTYLPYFYFYSKTNC
jgi:hypothetical protein